MQLYEMFQTPQEHFAIVVARAFVDAVKAGGREGAPASMLYAAVADKLSTTDFDAIVRELVDRGVLMQCDNQYYFLSEL